MTLAPSRQPSNLWRRRAVRSSIRVVASSIPVPEATKLLRELVSLTDFPITSTLMGLGCYPASGKNWLGMLGMHGSYEANMAMHDCDVMVCIGARFDDRITAASTRSRRIPRRSTSTSIRRRSTRMSALTFRSRRCRSLSSKTWSAPGVRCRRSLRHRRRPSGMRALQVARPQLLRLQRRPRT